VKLQVLGIDLGKTVFHLVGLDSTGRVVIRQSRRKLAKPSRPLVRYYFPKESIPLSQEYPVHPTYSSKVIRSRLPGFLGRRETKLRWFM
jgi:hypothetical protein